MLLQILGISAVNLRALPRRWGASLVVVVSMAGVVGVMITILAMARGFELTLTEAGRADRVVIHKSGQDNGMASAITREQLPIILNAPGIARDAEGNPIASAQKFMASALYERVSGDLATVQLRGVGKQAFRVWPEARIVEGRTFEFGKREVIAGRGAHAQFQTVEIGQDVDMVNGPWTVVGIFEAGGSLYESELWGDAELVFAGYSLTGEFSNVTAVLDSGESFQTLSDFITTNPQLSHVVKRENDYYAEQSGQITGALRALGYGVAIIMALGALFAAINALYAAVRKRTREIATLRAIGFGAFPVVISVLLEAVVLCLAGALLGAGLAWLVFNGYAVSTVNWQSGSQVAFAFRVSADLVAEGAAGAVIVGILGGLLPAVRAARLPVAEALRAA